MLGRIVLRYLLQGILLLTPLVTVSGYGLLDELHLGQPLPNGRYKVRFLPWDNDSQLQAQFEVALILTAMFFVGVALTEVSDFYLPHKRLNEYRNAYLEEKAEAWKTTIGAGMRINIMYAKRRWWLGFMPRLEWAWGLNYVRKGGEDADHGLCFLWFQGVCGKAYRTKDSVAASALAIKQWYRGPFRLGPRQIKRTEHVRAVLSIPIMDASWGGTGKKLRCVGVINIDAKTDKAAKRLVAREKEFIEYFGGHGKILASLRT